MTEQADLKARMEELRPLAELEALCAERLFSDHARITLAQQAWFLIDALKAAEQRITDLEAEWDGYCNGVGQVRHELKAAESRLVLAEKVVEAGRVLLALHDRWMTCNDGFMGNQADAYYHIAKRFDDWKAARAALTAYEENTYSNDLTTGEDDA